MAASAFVSQVGNPHEHQGGGVRDWLSTCNVMSQRASCDIITILYHTSAHTCMAFSNLRANFGPPKRHSYLDKIQRIDKRADLKVFRPVAKDLTCITHLSISGTGTTLVRSLEGVRLKLRFVGLFGHGPTPLAADVKLSLGDFPRALGCRSCTAVLLPKRECAHPTGALLTAPRAIFA